MKHVLNVFTFWVLFFLRIVFVKSAGVAVHLNVASRVKFFIPDSLKGFESEYYAGSFHPDAFYNCFGLSLAAENAHWPPFLKAAVEYCNQTYTSKGLKNEALKAFIYGVFTHQVSDVAWHSLQSYQGLMRMIAEVEFDGNFQNAHNFLDTNGDFIHLNREFENLSDADLAELVDFYKKEWTYPIQDIVDIYHLLGFSDITETEVKVCMDRGFSALQGEIMAVLTDRATNHRLSLGLQSSPLSFVLLNNYYYGGIDQITNTLALCMKELDGWFLGVPASDAWKICQPVFKRHKIEKQTTNDSVLNNFVSYSCSNLEIFSQPSSDKLYLSSGVLNSQFGTSIKIANFLGEPTIAISAPYEEIYGSVYLIPLKEILPDNTKDGQIQNSNFTKFTSSGVLLSDSSGILNYPTRFGDKMFTWKLKGYEFLVVSEPGLTHLKVFLYGSLVAILEEQGAETVLGQSGIKQWTILNKDSYDLNSDGWPELVLGSMFSDDYQLRFQGGLVVILDGKRFYDILSSISNFALGSEAPVISIELVTLQTYETPEILHQSNEYEQFGTSFALTKAFVLIGVNSAGGIAVFERETKKYLGLLSSEGETLITHRTQGRKTSEQHSLYAFNGILTGMVDGVEWVIVSSAGYSFERRCPLCGLVYLYKLQGESFELVTKLKPTTTNKHRNIVLSLFGSSMVKISDSLVVLGSSSYDDGRGALFKINLRELLAQEKGSHEYTSVEPFFTADKGIGFTNFGYDCIESFTFQKHTYIAVSLANHFYPQSVDDGKKFSGSVLIFELK